MRSASLLRATPIRSQPCRSLILAGSVSATSPTKTQQKFYASGSWTNPARLTRGTADNIADIRKPQSSSYNFPKKKEQETNGQEPVEPMDFASDFLDFSDINPTKRANREEPPAAPSAHLRMVPRTGRTVYVKNNVDVARSFKLLAVQVSQNGLRRDFQLQRFHERPGKKRKRLRSERWRKRFQKGFKATISRVRELTTQGW
ncbi:hypothetical protein CHU98_g6811 [Xylaria longipes]|nr:hypothetical protein CHU98_g6811 [Xylaria longipes]